METGFPKHLHNNFPFLKGKKILLAISGGIDSVVLAHLCKRTKLKVSFAHCNFHLRKGESDIDEAFVKELASKLDQEVFVEHFDTEKFAADNHMSIQVAARELRYGWFEKLANKHTFDYILTAHHANDSLETFLINTIRGTGLEGLTGIPEKNGKIIRPLLPFSRKEIRVYAMANGISWREDSSNASIAYERNKIRHRVIPIFEEENPQVLESFVKTQRHLQEASDLLKEYTSQLFQEIVEEIGEDLHFDIQKIKEKSNPRAVLYQLLKPFGFTAWEDIHHLLSSQSGKMILSSTHRLLKDRKTLILTKINHKADLSQEIEIDPGTDQIDFPGGKLIFEDTDTFGKTNKNQIYVDKNLVKFPLRLRKWKKSDYFYPFGMKGRKKISNYLKDNKFSLIDKEKIWLLLSEEKIIWIIGQRADDRFRIKPGISKVMSVHLLK